MLDLGEVGESDSGVFTCGDQIASLFVEVLITEPLLLFRRSETSQPQDLFHTSSLGQIGFECSVRGNPAPELELELRAAEHDTEIDLAISLGTVTRDGLVTSSTWVVLNSQTYYRILFRCTARQLRSVGHVYSTQTSGHVFLTEPLEVRLHNGDKSDFIFGESFTVGCSSWGNPPPKTLSLMRGGEEVETLDNIHFFNYHMRFEVTFDSATSEEEGVYTCVANDTIGMHQSRRYKARVFDRSSHVQILHREPDKLEFELENSQIEVEEGGLLAVKCVARDGFPKAHLILILNEIRIHGLQDWTSESYHETQVQINASSELVCEAWQHRFGEEVLTASDRVIITAIPPPSSAVAWLYSPVPYLRISMLVLISIAVATTLLILIACWCQHNCTAHESSNLHLLSNSEEEELRARSVRQAHRKLDLINHLAGHPILAHDTVVSCRNRSRGSLDSLRYQSGGGDTPEQLSRFNTPEQGTPGIVGRQTGRIVPATSMEWDYQPYQRELEGTGNERVAGTGNGRTGATGKERSRKDTAEDNLFL